MNKTLIFRNLMILGLIISVVSCKEDDGNIDPVLPYETGVFVSNEGPFQNGTGTITYYNRTTDVATNNLFNLVNGRELGNIVQSINFYSGSAYIVANNAGKIEVVNGDSFVEEGVITGLTMPRYFLGLNPSKGYVTEWGENGVNGAIQIVNLTDNTITGKIDLGSGSENMLQVGNFVYVPNGGGFGTDSTVSVVDITTDAVVATIPVGINPKSLQTDIEGNIWVLCAGYSDWMDPTNNIAGRLVKIDPATNQVVLSLDFPDASSQPNNLISNNGGLVLYYNYNGQVMHQRTDLDHLTNLTAIPRTFYSLGFDVQTDYIYGGDAGDYASDGQVFRYQTDGTVVDSFPTGIIPGGFYFK